MREIQASDAKARLPQLLDDVERGETLIITRHGRAIARLSLRLTAGRKKSTEPLQIFASFESEPWRSALRK
ncbi:MAG TPA: type II toxin-antitoxin system prevent-host-death family antitoxin [Bryobacteraceae bacterium]|nr:type II toxin-antitoxin system prevent-host-death family antitoxin [Bryobacteraceae bacterium]